MFASKKLREENKRLQIELEKKVLENTQYKDDLSQKDIEIKELKDKANLYLEAVKLEESCKFEVEEELEKLAKKYKRVNGALGGYKKEVNKLNQQLKECNEEKSKLVTEVKNLELKLEESMSNKYLVRTLPPQKSRTIQKTRLKNRVVNSSAKEILKEKSESEEENV